VIVVTLLEPQALTAVHVIVPVPVPKVTLTVPVVLVPDHPLPVTVHTKEVALVAVAVNTPLDEPQGIVGIVTTGLPGSGEGFTVNEVAAL